MNLGALRGSRASILNGFVVTLVMWVSMFSTASAAAPPERTSVCAGLYEAIYHGRNSKVSYHPVPVTPATARTATVSVEEIGKKISFDRIQNLEPYKPVVQGFSGSDLFSGYVDGKKVFVKVSPVKVGEIPKKTLAMDENPTRTAEDFRNEVAFTHRLEELGIGPKFYGVSELNGRNVIVTEFIEGHLVKFNGRFQLPKDYRPTPEVIKSIEHIADVIRHEGINPHDLQMILTPSRAYVIDPELLQPAEMYYQIDMVFEDVVTLLHQIRKRIQETSPGAR